MCAAFGCCRSDKVVKNGVVIKQMGKEDWDFIYLETKGGSPMEVIEKMKSVIPADKWDKNSEKAFWFSSVKSKTPDKTGIEWFSTHGGEYIIDFFINGERYTLTVSVWGRFYKRKGRKVWYGMANAGRKSYGGIFQPSIIS
jgi:hypothetical protein